MLPETVTMKVPCISSHVHTVITVPCWLSSPSLTPGPSQHSAQWEFLNSGPGWATSGFPWGACPRGELKGGPLHFRGPQLDITLKSPGCCWAWLVAPRVRTGFQTRKQPGFQGSQLCLINICTHPLPVPWPSAQRGLGEMAFQADPKQELQGSPAPWISDKPPPAEDQMPEGRVGVRHLTWRWGASWGLWD